MTDTSNAVADILAHHGVKGMHWGIRKEYETLKNKPAESVTLKTEKGRQVTLNESHVPFIAAAIGAISPHTRQSINASRSFKINVDGNNVGDVSIHEKSKDEVNFTWIGVNRQFRGQGYASTVFDAGVAYAKQKGYSKISLEVPGNSPDARHIYEKKGFKPTEEIIGEADDVWGGLTVMEYKIPNSRKPR